MEELLKSRNLGSATARRQRMAERQRHKELMYQQREERKRRLARYSQVYSTGSEGSRSNSPELDSAADTPSEYSAQTPDNVSIPDMGLKLEPVESIEEALPPPNIDVQTMLKTPTTLTPQTEAQPVLFGASLSRPCDFRYDRFSTIMGNSDVSGEELDTSEDDEPEDDDPEGDDDAYSPIEIATPVSILTPTTKPVVITVGGPALSLWPKGELTKSTAEAMISASASMSHAALAPPEVTQHPAASRAQLMASENSSMLSVVSLESQVPQEPSALDRSVAEQYLLKKKSSMPMLTKLAHSRMNSIKQFMKPGSVSPAQAPALPQLPAHHSGSFTSVSSSFSHTTHRSAEIRSEKITPEPVKRSLTDSTLLIASSTQSPRPPTTRQVSSASTIHPPRHDSVAGTTPSLLVQSTENAPPSISRKKSFNNLRRRSGSLGQALKFGSSRSKTSSNDAPLPPMPPTDRVTSQDFSYSLSNSASQALPPKTSQTSSIRRSGVLTYPPFPLISSKDKSVGLGLSVQS